MPSSPPSPISPSPAPPLATWIDSSILGPDWVRWLVLVMLVEFIVVHSSALLGAVELSDTPARRRVGGALGLGALYTLFLLGFALAFGSWWPVVTSGSSRRTG